MITPMMPNNNRNKKRRQTLLSSSSSGACENSSGVSSGSGSAARTASEDSSELQALNLMEQRRKRRKESNRESARRSRMRKQMHVDGMAEQVASLRAENYKMLVMLERATIGFLTIESENSVLRTQVLELQSRLRSLNDIIKCMHMHMNMNMNADAAGDMSNNSFGGFGGSWGHGADACHAISGSLPVHLAYYN
jgi:bZIP transcription factor